MHNWLNLSTPEEHRVSPDPVLVDFTIDRALDVNNDGMYKIVCSKSLNTQNCS
jgi:hypothetical protein